MHNPQLLLKSIIFVFFIAKPVVSTAQYQISFLFGQSLKVDGRNIQREPQLNDVIGKNDAMVLDDHCFLILYDLKRKSYNFVSGSGQLSYADIKAQIASQPNNSLLESVINFSVPNKNAKADLKTYQEEMMKNPNYIERKGCKENLTLTPFHNQSISITNPTGEYRFSWNKKDSKKTIYVFEIMKNTADFNNQILLSKEVNDTTLTLNLDSLLKANLLSEFFMECLS